VEFVLQFSYVTVIMRLRISLGVWWLVVVAGGGWRAVTTLCRRRLHIFGQCTLLFTDSIARPRDVASRRPRAPHLAAPAADGHCFDHRFIFSNGYIAM
jgi:hypothetical protein